MGCLYAITFENGKKYIGVTKHTAEFRFNQHVRYFADRDTTLVRAIKKYGSEKCRVDTLMVSNDAVYLKEMEVRAIKVYGTLRPKGYNSTLGGNGVLDPSGHSEARRVTAMKQTMATGDYKARHRAIQSSVWDDERRKKRSEEIAAKWRDPVYRARLVAAHKRRGQSVRQS